MSDAWLNERQRFGEFLGWMRVAQLWSARQRKKSPGDFFLRRRLEVIVLSILTVQVSCRADMPRSLSREHILCHPRLRQVPAIQPKSRKLHH